VSVYRRLLNSWTKAYPGAPLLPLNPWRSVLLLTLVSVFPLPVCFKTSNLDLGIPRSPTSPPPPRWVSRLDHFPAFPGGRPFFFFLFFKITPPPLDFFLSTPNSCCGSFSVKNLSPLAPIFQPYPYPPLQTNSFFCRPPVGCNTASLFLLSPCQGLMLVRFVVVPFIKSVFLLVRSRTASPAFPGPYGRFPAPRLPSYLPDFVVRLIFRVVGRDPGRVVFVRELSRAPFFSWGQGTLVMSTLEGAHRFLSYPFVRIYATFDAFPRRAIFAGVIFSPFSL